ncbi:hypothetical protein RvY_03102 [Ramazzottius varieornatus]|uniref:Uncharacterized protein n=1 Tax=Ramazzottius varieornatus TaxID=947166 RepID=A0A1D1ULZ0_RAMVA|nr:hypothetical protein RvY_03102 [Ramazzottius varieornatus]
MTSGPDATPRNHVLSEENYCHERENRLLHARKTQDAVQLVQNGVPVRQTAAALRLQIKKPVREKDLHNPEAHADRALNTGVTEGSSNMYGAVRFGRQAIKQIGPDCFGDLQSYTL